MQKLFKVADIHNWLKRVTTDKISYSRMVELMNQKVSLNTYSIEEVNILLSLLGKAKDKINSEWQKDFEEAMRNYWTCESCSRNFAGNVHASDDMDNPFCKGCYDELAPVMKSEYEKLKANGDLD